MNESADCGHQERVVSMGDITSIVDGFCYGVDDDDDDRF